MVGLECAQMLTGTGSWIRSMKMSQATADQQTGGEGFDQPPGIREVGNA